MKNFDVLSISSRASVKRNLGYKVIDGSIGMLLNDDKTLSTFDVINKEFDKKISDTFAYGPSRGIEVFKDDVIKWIFKSKFNYIKKNLNVSYAATAGGTNALFLVLKKYSGKKNCVLFPELSWQNYKNICNTVGLKCETFNSFDENGNFNLTSLKESLDSLTKSYEKTIIILNDPCHNPTGYSLAEKEFNDFINLLIKYKDKVTLILDIAYLDFATSNFHFTKFLNVKFPFNIYLSFSGSKCFGAYGLRVGAVLGFLKSSKDVDEENEEFRKIARATISSPNNSALRVIHKVFENENKIKKLHDSIDKKIKDLKDRSDFFITKLKENNIDFYPYKSGFFVTLKFEKSYDLADYLEDKNIFLLPLSKDKIRVAVSALNKKELTAVANAINSFKK